MHVFDFKWRGGQPCQWLSGTNNWVSALVGNVIIVWRNTHNNTESYTIWFPVTLIDTDLNIQEIQVKNRTNGNCNIPARESRLWGIKWYYLFSAQVCMLRRRAYGFFPQRFSIERSRTAFPGAVLQRAKCWYYPCKWRIWCSKREPFYGFLPLLRHVAPLSTRIVASQYPSSRDAVLLTRYLTPIISVCLNAIKQFYYNKTYWQRIWELNWQLWRCFWQQ